MGIVAAPAGVLYGLTPVVSSATPGRSPPPRGGGWFWIGAKPGPGT